MNQDQGSVLIAGEHLNFETFFSPGCTLSHNNEMPQTRLPVRGNTIKLHQPVVNSQKYTRQLSQVEKINVKCQYVNMSIIFHNKHQAVWFLWKIP